MLMFCVMRDMAQRHKRPQSQRHDSHAEKPLSYVLTLCIAPLRKDAGHQQLAHAGIGVLYDANARR